MIPVENFRGEVCAACAAERDKAAREARAEAARRRKAFRVARNPEVPSVDDRPGEKVCIKCGRTLPLEQFPTNPLLHGGHDSRCRECLNAQRKVNRDGAKEDDADESVERSVASAFSRVISTSAPKWSGELPKLKLCPFCGRAPRLHRVQVCSVESWEIVCSCFDEASPEGLSRWIGMDFETPDQAAAFWNRRSKAKGAA